MPPITPGPDGPLSGREPPIHHQRTSPTGWTATKGSSRGGIGWILDDWDGHQVFSHGGNTIGQASMLWVVDDTIVCVAANGGHTMAFEKTVAAELFGELLGVRPPTDPTPPETPVEVDVARYAGVYERAGVKMTLTAGDGVLDTLGEPTGLEPPRRFDLIPMNETTFVGRPEGEPQWMSAVF